MSFCKISIIGNLGGNPEIKDLTNDTCVCSFSVAVNEKQKKNNEYVSLTNWYRIVLFNNLAKIATDYLKKGSKVYIEGKLRINKFLNKNGEEKQIIEIVGSNLVFLDKIETENDTEYKSVKTKEITPSFGDQTHDYDDIPF